MTPLPAREVETDVIDAARRGDRDAVAALYREHAGGLLLTLRGLLRDRALAEDVLHDLFVGLPEALQRYDERGTLRRWLGVVAVRLALMRLRTRRRRREVTLDEMSLPTIGDPGQVTDAIAVRDALRQLPEKLRIVVVLRDLEGWSYADIARHTGVSEAALMARHSRAMKRLQTVLKEES